MALGGMSTILTQSRQEENDFIVRLYILKEKGFILLCNKQGVWNTTPLFWLIVV